MKKDERAEENDKKFVIFAPNTVIEIFAMVIKFLSATIASLAVVASLLTVTDAYLAVFTIVICEGQVRIEKIVINGISDRYHQINHNKKS